MNLRDRLPRDYVTRYAPRFAWSEFVMGLACGAITSLGTVLVAEWLWRSAP